MPETHRPRLLDDRPGEGRLSVLAIDFGTSSSTATLFDAADGERPLGLWPAQAAVQGAQLAEMLTDWPDGGAAAVEAQVLAALGEEPQREGVVAERLGRYAEYLRGIGRRRFWSAQNVDWQAGAPLLDATSLVLDQHPTFAWLAERLDAAAEHVGAVAVPAAMDLTPVLIDHPELLANDDPQSAGPDLDVPSCLLLSEGRADRTAKLGPWNPSEHAFIGLKRHLLRPKPVPRLMGVPAGWEPDTDLLIALSYCDVVRRTYKFGDGVESLQGRVLDSIAATYPTVTPPAARSRLRSLLADAFGIARLDVNIEYDEGVAAALYFLMRQLGSEIGHGVEALRCGATRIGDGLWRKNLLVVDIGGGTTDIALIQIDLAEQDRDDAGPATRGRHYRLSPRLRGTTGHAQLGGDLLTLRVFYWLKAVLADALEVRSPSIARYWPVGLTAEPAPSALAPLVVGFREPGPAPLAVRAVLQRILPTQTTDDGDARDQPVGEAFGYLWRVAEQAKRVLAAGQAFELTSKSESKSMIALESQLGVELQSLFPLRLEPSDFDRLAEPVLAMAMRLAGALARRRLGGDVLHTVALSGRTCGMPVAGDVARRVLADALNDEPERSATVAWNPASVVVEEAYAKQAASTGPAGAASRARVAATLVDEELRAGDTVIDIELGRLKQHLPCGFELVGPDGTARPILEAGQPLEGEREDGTTFVAGPWLSLRDEIILRRKIETTRRDRERSVQWGKFRYRERNRREQEAATLAAEPAPDAAALVLDPPADPPDDVYFCIEMDEDLLPTLLLRRGREDHWEIEPVQGPIDLGLRFGGRLAATPRVIVELVGPDNTQPVVLFEAGAPFDGWLHGPGAGAPILGVVSGQPLPKPAVLASDDLGGLVRYRVSVEGAATTEITMLRPELTTDRPGEHWACLDDDGGLWILQARPWRLEAESLHQMEEVFGSVYATRMEDDMSERELLWDPFTGRH